MIEQMLFTLTCIVGVFTCMYYRNNKDTKTESAINTQLMSDSKIIDMFLDSIDSKEPYSERVIKERESIRLMRKSRLNRNTITIRYELTNNVVDIRKQA